MKRDGVGKRYDENDDDDNNDDDNNDDDNNDDNNNDDDDENDVDADDATKINPAQVGKLVHFLLLPNLSAEAWARSYKKFFLG